MCLETEERAADMSLSHSHLLWEPAVSFHKGHGMKMNLIALKKENVYLHLPKQIESMIFIKAAIKWLLDCNVGCNEPISH